MDDMNEMNQTTIDKAIAGYSKIVFAGGGDAILLYLAKNDEWFAWFVKRTNVAYRRLCREKALPGNFGLAALRQVLLVITLEAARETAKKEMKL